MNRVGDKDRGVFLWGCARVYFFLSRYMVPDMASSKSNHYIKLNSYPQESYSLVKETNINEIIIAIAIFIHLAYIYGTLWMRSYSTCCILQIWLCKLDAIAQIWSENWDTTQSAAGIYNLIHLIAVSCEQFFI